MILPALFHWSPSERRGDIERLGLQPRQLATTHSDPSLTSPYICFSTTPSRAWSLSGAMEWVSEVDSWDLWQVRLADGGHVDRSRRLRSGDPGGQGLRGDTH